MTPDQQTVEWLGQFPEYLKTEMAYSEHTIKSCRMDLEKFSYHLGKHLLKATSRDIANFIAGRLDAGMSPISARRQLSAIRSFYGFVLTEEGLTQNPHKRYIRAESVPPHRSSRHFRRSGKTAGIFWNGKSSGVA